MTLGAISSSMFAGEREVGLVMLERRYRHPGSEVVATQAAVGGDLSSMLVLMTGKTVLFETQEGSLEILSMSDEFFLLLDPSWVVALIAGDLSMGALQ